MKIWDAFIYNNESDILKIRCEELKSLGVTHVLVESGFTFTGNIKTLYYWDFCVKNNYGILPFICQNVPNNGNAWDNEKVQRNHILTVLEGLGAMDDDIVIISDVDEIPRAESIKQYNPEMGLTALKMDVFWYKLNCLAERQTWTHTRIMTFGYLKDKTPNEVRSSGFQSVIDNAGWHFSYCGDEDFIINKLESFSHSEYDTPQFKNKELLKEKTEKGESIWGESQFTFLPIDDSFPNYIINNQKEFEQLIHKI